MERQGWLGVGRGWGGPTQPLSCLQLQPQEHRRVGDPEQAVPGGPRLRSCRCSLLPQPGWLCVGSFRKTRLCVGALGAPVCVWGV